MYIVNLPTNQICNLIHLNDYKSSGSFFAYQTILADFQTGFITKVIGILKLQLSVWLSVYF